MQFVDFDLFGLEMIILKGDLSNKSNTQRRTMDYLKRRLVKQV